MLFSDIKSCLIEYESEEGFSDSEYINNLESCRNIDALIQIVSDYMDTDELEASEYILKKVCR